MLVIPAKAGTHVQKYRAKRGHYSQLDEVVIFCYIRA